MNRLRCFGGEHQAHRCNSHFRVRWRGRGGGEGGGRRGGGVEGDLVKGKPLSKVVIEECNHHP